MSELLGAEHLHIGPAAKQRAIETVYRGYEFRSRLEAKWAAFFDLCGWKWSYEPPELAGWIPDFALGEPATLVEIKPFFHESQWWDTGTVQKSINAGCTQNILLLGADATWWHDEGDRSGPQIGWELIQPSGPEAVFIDPLLFGFAGNGKLGLCCENHAWVNRVWNLPNGQDSLVRMEGVHEVEQHLVANWAEACNRSKWMPVANNERA